MEFDIVVCGAGPAGSVAAFEAAKGGPSVLLIDRKEHPGIPVCCAEGVSRSMVSGFIDLEKDWIATRVNGAMVISGSDMVSISYPGVGYILDRKRFDLGLVNRAIKAGCQFIVGEITEIRKAHLILNRKDRIDFKVPILADGVESVLARRLGIRTTLSPSDLHTCAQFLITGIDHPEDKATFILDAELIPGGYGWIFPKGDNVYNFGLGVSPGRSKLKPFEYLKKLKGRYIPKARIIKKTGGVVPAKILDLKESERFIIGDAGRLTDPLSGGGIANAIRSGFLAGRYATLILKGKGDYQEYYHELKNLIIDEIRFHEKVRKVYLKLKDEDFKELIRVLDRIYKGREVRDINSKDLVGQILRSSPQLLRLGLRLIKDIILDRW